MTGCDPEKLCRSPGRLALLVVNLNPLAANDEYTRIRNLIFLWFWTPRTTNRSSATHSLGSSLILTDEVVQKQQIP